MDTIFILQRMEDNANEGRDALTVDDLGRIILSAELRNKLGVNIADGIAIYNTDNLMILKAA